MTGLLRFVGLLNAAVWLGSCIFVMAGLPALFSPELKRLLTPAGVGFAAESIIGRYFLVQYWCAAIAIAHLLAESFYLGRPLRRANLAVLSVLLALGLAGGLLGQPKMRSLHIAHYFARTEEQRDKAGKSFAFWHITSETANLVVMAGLLWYFWRLNREEEPDRFVSFSKMRG